LNVEIRKAGTDWERRRAPGLIVTRSGFGFGVCGTQKENEDESEKQNDGGQEGSRGRFAPRLTRRVRPPSNAEVGPLTKETDNEEREKRRKG